MSWLKSEDVLNEIIFNIQHKDLIKAKLVMEHVDHIDNATQKRIMYELAMADPDFSIPLIAHVIQKNKSYVNRYPELKDALFQNILQKPSVLLELLNKETLDIYIDMVGELQLADAIPVLLEKLEKDDDLPQKMKIIENLGNIGDPKPIHKIANYLYHESRRMVFITIEALAKIETPESMQILANRMGKEEDVDLILLEKFSEVQDFISLRKLNEAMKSYSPILRNFAKNKMDKIGKKMVPVLMENLYLQDPNTLVHTLNIIGDLGDESAVSPIRKIITSNNDPNVRFAAYEAIGKLPGKKGNFVLANGLIDMDDNVRVAAAKAVDTKYDNLLAAGIRNLLDNEDKDASQIIKVIIDAQADQVFLDLIDKHPFFTKGAMDYLQDKVHLDIKNHFYKLLMDHHYIDHSKKLMEKPEAQPEVPNLLVCAVDDSKLILKIYKSVLYEMGYDSMLFENPSEALAWLRQLKPAILCTDLNMPQMTGIELTKELRKTYSKSDLPIVMVTTQDDNPDMLAAKEAGVNEFVQKPFNAEKLSIIFRKYINQ
ncbi:MAG: response regulator [Candidatus Marinimicrobia bacterium]|nr:response regulator [Candidatus Neomarinimicrobiota bacterium]